MVYSFHLSPTESPSLAGTWHYNHMETTTIKLRCYNCGEEVNSKDGYCEHCGYKLYGARRNEIQKPTQFVHNANVGGKDEE